MNYPQPKYPKSTVDEAGETLISDAVPSEVYDHALTIINNWRACHNLPLLHFRLWLNRLAQRVDPGCLIAQRIKRLPAIRLKLQLLQSRLKLSQMQDIGGCRAIVKNVQFVKLLVNRFKQSQAKHPLNYVNDYIAKPKKTGYRGVHLIYRFQSAKYTQHCGLRIEIQLRSRLQHAWATAVETVGIFTGEALKSNLGSQDWRRFFALMGTAIAMKEKAPLVPNTPTTREALVAELHDWDRKLKAQTTLAAYSSMLRLPRHPELTDSAYFLLQLDPKAQTIIVKGYKQGALKEASEEYLEVERKIALIQSDVMPQAVLVSVGSLSSLKRTYPNYFLDMRVFIEEVQRALN